MARRRRSGDDKTLEVPSIDGTGHLTGIRQRNRICERARLADITPHTLRHTFASLAGDLGFSELAIAALLGHASRGVTQRYIHIDEALRLAADRVVDEMADILDGKATIAQPRRRGSRRSQEAPEAANGIPQTAG